MARPRGFPWGIPMRIDLHVHSTFSDGVFSPRELVEMAVDRSVAVLSLADHDCVEGIEEARDAGDARGVEIVSGVELSSEFHGRDLHILGYGFDEKNDELREMLRRFRDTRQKRGIRIVENLKKMGVELDIEEVLAKSPDGSLGRPHIAEALIEKGYAGNHSEAFARYLGEDSPAYVKKHKLAPGEAINYIRTAGGLAFLAHPGNYLENGINELLEYGFDGMEIIHPNHSADDVRRLRAMADKFGLLMSGGTDFHGFSGRDMPMGDLDVPEEIWTDLKERLHGGR